MWRALSRSRRHWTRGGGNRTADLSIHWWHALLLERQKTETDAQKVSRSCWLWSLYFTKDADCNPYTGGAVWLVEDTSAALLDTSPESTAPSPPRSHSLTCRSHSSNWVIGSPRSSPHFSFCWLTIARSEGGPLLRTATLFTWRITAESKYPPGRTLIILTMMCY